MARVAIIGGGISGLTIGRLLQDSDHQVTIYEKDLNQAAQGAGILLATNAMRVLKAMGLSEKIEELGNPIERQGLKSQDGAIRNSALMDGYRQKYGTATCAIHRKRLHQVLREGLLIKDNCELEYLEESSSGVCLRWKSGATNEVDYVIGADGLGSQTYCQIFGSPSFRLSQMTCFRGVTMAPEYSDSDFFEYWSRYARFGFASIGHGEVYWYGVVKDRYRADVWQKPFQVFPEQVKTLVERTPTPLVHPMVDRSPDPRWFTQRVVLLGDAAHPMTPNLGQGACMAIESAWVLAQEILQSGFGVDAFQRYQKRRIPRTRKYTQMAYWVGQFAQVSNPLLLFARNLIVSIGGKDVTRQLADLYDVELGPQRDSRESRMGPHTR